MKHQEIFDFVITKLAKQRAISMNNDGACLYRKNKKANCKTKCAVGWLIKDEFYDPIMDAVEEDNTDILYNDAAQKALRKSGIRVDIDFLADLQNAHDLTTQQTLAGIRQNWKIAFTHFAEMYSLKTDVLNKAFK